VELAGRLAGPLHHSRGQDRDRSEASLHRRPNGRCESSCNLQLQWVVWTESTLQTTSSKAPEVQRDHSFSTINESRKDFFLESALVVGGKMLLDANLRDDATKLKLESGLDSVVRQPVARTHVLQLVGTGPALQRPSPQRPGHGH